MDLLSNWEKKSICLEGFERCYLSMSKKTVPESLC